MVTMLEKAINYVKFLQLQVKVCSGRSVTTTVSTQFNIIDPNLMIRSVIVTQFVHFGVYTQVLATDEFWPVQGGKAPELSQVKDALDAILSSQHQS
jgi:hypothetical protein